MNKIKQLKEENENLKKAYEELGRHFDAVSVHVEKLKSDLATAEDTIATLVRDFETSEDTISILSNGRL